MAIKTYRPITPSQRFKTTLTNDELTASKPHKPLTQIKRRTGGRRNSGDITIWHPGGPAAGVRIKCDPTLAARFALFPYPEGEKRYITQPGGWRGGQKFASGRKPDFRVANALPQKTTPAGTTIHNVELRPGKGAQM